MTTLFQSLDETAGLEFHGVVDGKRAFSEFLPFVPEKIQVRTNRCLNGALCFVLPALAQHEYIAPRIK
jgi:hypothetical protein